MNLRVIAIDGPAASGKSSVAREVARRLGWVFVNTGNMYRAATWAALRDGINPTDEAAVVSRSGTWNISCSLAPDRSSVQVDGQDVEAELNSPEVNSAVSFVARVPAVREKLVGIQQQLGQYRQSLFPVSARSVQLAQNGYADGLASILEVLQAQRQQADLNAAYLNTLDQFLQALARLHTAVGDYTAAPATPDTDHKDF